MTEDDDISESDIPDLSDEKLMSRKRIRDDRERTEEEQLWREVLKTRIGRRSLYRFIARTGHFLDVIFAVTPTGHPDQYSTWFHLGRKAIGGDLFRLLERVDFESVKLMLDENDPDFAKPKGRRT